MAELLASPPGVIVAQIGPDRLGIEGVTTPYPEYFARYEGFTKLWQGYQLAETVGNFQVFIRK